MKSSTASQLSDVSEQPRREMHVLAHISCSEVCNPADAFFRAWKTGAELAGCRYFGDGTLKGIKEASCRWDLRPNLRVVNTLFEVLTEQERVFLAALVSFFDPDVGGSLLQQSGVKGLADLGLLTTQQRFVIAGLVMHNHAW